MPYPFFIYPTFLTTVSDIVDVGLIVSHTFAHTTVVCAFNILSKQLDIHLEWLQHHFENLN